MRSFYKVCSLLLSRMCKRKRKKFQFIFIHFCNTLIDLCPHHNCNIISFKRQEQAHNGQKNEKKNYLVQSTKELEKINFMAFLYVSVNLIFLFVCLLFSSSRCVSCTCLFRDEIERKNSLSAVSKIEHKCEMISI